MKIVLPDAKTIMANDLDISELNKYGDVDVYDISNYDELKDKFRDADIILGNKSIMNEETLSEAKNLKYIGITATGYNNVDLEYTRKRGIVVSNAAGYSTNAVAQQTFAYILNHYNKVETYNNFVKEDGWKKSDVFAPIVFPMYEVANKTIGIIGFGSIGKKVAKIAASFDMNIIVYSRNMEKVENTIKDEFSDYVEKIKYVDFETLISKSDIVTIHCPLNKESDGMMNEEVFRKFKRDSFFINTARGNIVDENALAKALNEGWIGGAAVDVLREEPMSEYSVLNEAKNIVITPHVAWAPYETRKRLFDIVVDNMVAFLNGEPKSVVNG